MQRRRRWSASDVGQARRGGKRRLPPAPSLFDDVAVEGDGVGVVIATVANDEIPSVYSPYDHYYLLVFFSF